MQKRFKIFIILIILLQSFFLHSELIGQAKQGVLDLREKGLNKRYSHRLVGEWEFYWKRFIEPDSFLKTNPPAPDLYGKVPSYWTAYTLNGENLSREGFASYRLLILLPHGFRESLVFNVPVFDSSFKLFINGKPSGGNGIVGTSPQNSEPEYNPFLIEVTPKSDTLEVLVQVSNFQHRRGGFWIPIKIGTSARILQDHQRYVFISYLSMGVLMAFTLLFLFFFLFYRKDWIPFLFSVFLAGILIRLVSTGIYPLKLISGISWDWLIRLEYLGTYMAAIAGSWFFHFLYPVRIMQRVNVFNSIILLFSCLIILLSDVNVFAYSMIYFQLIAILYLLFYLCYSFVSVFTMGSFNLIYFAGFFLFFLALLNDIGLAASRAVISWDYTIHLAVQILIFIHAIMLIRTWIKSFIEKDELNEEIIYLNANLDNLISERTFELQKRNKDIVVQNEKIALQNKMLKEEIDVKNRIFSIIAHDLKSPISSLILFFDVFKSETAKNLKDSALRSIQNLVISVNDLIDNLLYWGRSQGNQIAVKKRETEMDEIALKVVELFKEPAKQKSITINYQRTGSSIAFCDPELIQIVLRNLLSNAIKFTASGGKVSMNIGTNVENNFLVEISLHDEGVGMTEEKIKSILTGDKFESTFGTEREKGSGLGLRLCFDLVRLMDARMEIESQVNQGTKVKILLPVFETTSKDI